MTRAMELTNGKTRSIIESWDWTRLGPQYIVRIGDSMTKLKDCSCPGNNFEHTQQCIDDWNAAYEARKRVEPTCRHCNTRPCKCRF
ncbi:hypothetical protein LCGC14_1201480 [marine sediment metagenome]|uniref:Uncharacterized protein n=1 Tax=marine sediment metagenome TaxID=412755 RepID=A0A0F9NZ59_9ZZZZ